MRKHCFRFTLFLSFCFTFPLMVTARTVDISDPNLRATIETNLSKTSGARITTADMATLTYLEALNANIQDLTGLEHATNLTYLFLWNNSISDISPLSGLTQLAFIDLQGNPISDISPLKGLTNLLFLGLQDTSVSESTDTHLPILRSRGVEVSFGSTKTTGQGISGNAQQGINPSPVAQNRVIFNEIRNAADDNNDWIELKNISDDPVYLWDWEISIVNSNGENTNKDVDIVTFPDYTLPAGAVLLITNTDPRETDLIRGQNIADPNSNPDLSPHQLIAPKLILPDAPYMLILRSAKDKNGESEAVEDLVGNYFLGFVNKNYSTQVWPLKYTSRPPNRMDALLTLEEAWQRVANDKPGYTREAWISSDYQTGLGYRPKAPTQTSLGTPGYPTTSAMNEIDIGQISISEVMYATRGGLFSLSQWIELYNNSTTEVVNLKGWKLRIEKRDNEAQHRNIVIELKSLEILPNQTGLLVTRHHRHSGHIPQHRVYDLYRHHKEILKLGLRANDVLPASGFAVQLFSPNDILVDIAGNLDGDSGRDTPAWELLTGWTEDDTRTSMVRRYRNRVPLIGTEASSWIRAADTQLMTQHVWWGSPTDSGTPGYKQGGTLPVSLSHFRADRTKSGVVVKWGTESEIENAGFNILRSQTQAGRFVKVNPTLIPGAGTTPERHTYTWTDMTTKPHVLYYYQIEEVSFSGDSQRLGTVRLRGAVSADKKLITMWGDVKTQN